MKERTIKRGYGEGLIAYPEWIYKQFDKKALIKKKKEYLTPSEIRVIMEKD